MSWQLTLIVSLVALALLGFAIGTYLAHVAEDRRRALRYHQHRREAPASTVCPKCRRRSYSRRDVTRGFCEPCGLEYGRAARREAMRA